MPNATGRDAEVQPVFQAINKGWGRSAEQTDAELGLQAMHGIYIKGGYRLHRATESTQPCPTKTSPTTKTKTTPSQARNSKPTNSKHSRYKGALRLRFALLELTSHGRKTRIRLIAGYMHKLRKTDSSSSRSYKIPLPQLRRNPNQTRRQMPQIRQNIQMPQMRLHRTIKGERTWAA